MTKEVSKIEEAKKLIQDENDKKLKEFQKKLEALLDEYQLEMVIAPEITISGKSPQILIINKNQ